MWLPSEDAPNDVIVMTKIDDEKGIRNETTLKRVGNLWWTPDDSMYVYYRPTHYRRLTEVEQEAERAILKRKADALSKAAADVVAKAGF